MVIKDKKIYISVSQKDMDRAMEIAKVRNDKKTPGKKFEDSYSDLDIHYWGAIAEMAWSKVTGWEPDTSQLDGGDDGVDFVISGRTYQIKTRNIARYKDPDLLCRLDYAKADRYILSEIDADDLSRVIFVGWCTKEELVENTINIRGKGDRYVRYRDDLNPIPKNILRSHGRNG